MARRIFFLAALALLGACAGRQSVLDTAGIDADILQLMFWVMLTGAVAIWIAVNALMLYVTRRHPGRVSEKVAGPLIIWGGIVFPVVVLVALLSWGLSIMPDQRAPGDGLVVRVHGEQWWWRVSYHPEGDAAPIVAANEIRLPAGRRTDILLQAETVIHSFWIPALGGKMDMFPGRETRLSLSPTTPGTYRGQCAEFCGASHALMAFEVVVMPPEDFAAWLAQEAREARAPEDDLARTGAEVFLAQGCGGCHAVRGTPANGNVGPDLTHVGSRASLGAGTLKPTLDNFADWIAHTGDIKPEVEMPAYRDLSRDDLLALATYLKGLE